MQYPRVGTAVYTGEAQIHSKMYITNLVWHALPRVSWHVPRDRNHPLLHNHPGWLYVHQLQNVLNYHESNSHA